MVGEIHDKTKEEFFKEFPVKKITRFIHDLIRQVRGSTHLRGKSQAMDYFESQWDAFLVREIRPFHIKVIKESHSPLRKIRKGESISKEVEDWEDPLGFLPKWEGH